MAMKKQDINAVLKQAAQLRANLCSAIDRSLVAHFRRTPASSPTKYAHSAACGAENEVDFSPVFSATAFEARSLASIRDALLVLEEQLECLQMLPDEEKAEKKATLAELEESREILLRRLKQHRGREVAVIQEALSFLGASSDECQPVLLRSNTSPARIIDVDVRHEVVGGVEGSMNEGHSPWKKQCVKLDRSEMKQDGNAQSHGILSGLKSRFFGFLNRKLVKVSAKCLFTVAGAAAVLTLSTNAYGSNMRGRKRTSSMGRLNRAGCPEKWASVYSGGQRCVLTEPFKEEL